MKSSNQTNVQYVNQAFFNTGDLKRHVESVHEALDYPKEETILIGRSEKAACVFRVWCKDQIESKTTILWIQNYSIENM